MSIRTWTAVMMVWFLAITSANAITTMLVNYEQLVKALETGDDVKAIIRLDRCQITDPVLQSQLSQNLDGSSTRVNFTKYLHYKIRVNGQLRDTVTTSQVSFMEQSTNEVWSIQARLNVYEDNTAIFHVNFYDPAKRANQLVVDWLCDISNGRDENGLFLYDSP